MNFILGAIFGAVIISLAIMASIVYEPDDKVSEYRTELDLDKKEHMK